MKAHILRIHSVNNPLIKKITLLKQSKHRKDSNLFMAEGIRTVTTLTNSSLTLEYLFITDEHEQMAPSLAQSTTTVVLSTNTVLAKISNSSTPAGLIAIFKQPTYSLDQFKAPGIVLAQISDPGNMGTLIRSAAAFNAKTVVIVEGVDPWSPKVVQASAGSIGMVHLFSLSWDKLTKLCKERNIILNALVVNGNTTQSNNQNQLLVVGNEGHGLPIEWQKDCQLHTTIVMPGKTESLNAAVAGSIALHELLKNHKHFF
ncbi:MAG TPA: RNA methyltransferase [Patescibacteria group bacterium]|nr:RNA methyltransferase [Patescibacteria group bacterium]